MRRIAIAVLVATIALPASAQKLVDSIEVRIANIDVAVRDAAGKPVTGLTAGDFELFEDGVRQPITNLYEVRRDAALDGPGSGSLTETATTAPLELRQRKLILFIDNASLQPMRRDKILAALQKFIERDMRPEDQTMIVLWGLGLKVITPFTSDKSVVKSGLAGIAERANSGSTRQIGTVQIKRTIDDLIESARRRSLTWQEAYSRATQAIDAHSEDVIQQEKLLITALTRTTATLAGLDGKKVLVFAGEHLPERPGAELYQYAYDQFSPNMGRRSQLDIRSVTGATGNRVEYSIAEMARKASANGVTLYTIDAADSRDDISAESASAVSQSEAFVRFTNTAAAFQTLARVTGGLSISNTSNYDGVLERLAGDLNSYYSLGYKPVENGKSAERRIAVRTTNPAYNVRARQTFTPKSTDDQMNDRVIANIYNEGMSSEWPIRITAGAPSKDGSKFKVPIEVSLPSSITLLPQEGSLVGGFVLYIVVGDATGATSEITKSAHSLTIPPVAEAGLRSKPMTFNMAIMVNPGENTLSVGVIDQISNVTGLARARIVAR